MSFRFSRGRLAVALFASLLLCCFLFLRSSPGGSGSMAPPAMSEAPSERPSPKATAVPSPNQAHEPTESGSTASTAPLPTDTLPPLRELHWPDFAHPAILEREENGRLLHQVANHLVVTLLRPDDRSALDNWVADAPGRTLEHLAGDTYLIAWEGASAPLYAKKKTTLQALLAEAAVVEPNWIVRTTATQTGSLFWRQSSNYNSIAAPAGWEIRTSARDIVVAVVDSGIDYTHPDLVTRVRPRPGEIANTGRDDDGNGFIDDVIGWNFVDNNNDPMDADGHGTHVAGIIGADGTNDLFGTGVAWDVTLLPVRFLDAEGRGTVANEIRSLDYARVSGAHILNASYGGGGYSHAVLTRLQELNAAGIWFVTSAGNDRIDIDQHPVYPASYNVPNVIAVAALTGANLSSSSNFGTETVSLAAPGTNVNSTEPEEGFGPRSGTSMSAAMVSGALALLLAEFPDASMEDIRSRLIDRTLFSPHRATRVASGGRLHLGHSLAPGPGRPPTVTIMRTEEFPLEGTTTELRVVTRLSSGFSTLQWLHNGEPIPGAHGDTLRLTQFSEEKEGTYQLRVTDRFGEALSEGLPIFLRSRRPTIHRQPVAPRSSQEPGSEVVLRVEATSGEPLTYQWYFKNMPIPGATEAEFRIPELSLETAGSYRVRVSTDYASFSSQSVEIRLRLFTQFDWKYLASPPFKIVGKAGAYFLRETAIGYLLSKDFLSWSDHPEWTRALLYESGEYFLLTATGSIYRGPDIDQLERWWTGPHDAPSPHSQPIAFVRNGTHLIAQFPGSGDHHVYNLASATLRWGKRPGDTENPITSVGGYFWTIAGQTIYRSGDGRTWEAQPQENVLPLWEDEPTGWKVGRSTSPPTVFFRPPGETWQAAYLFDASTPLPVHALKFRFPGGFQDRQGQEWVVFDFHHDGAFRATLADTPQTPAALRQGNRQLVWADTDVLLFEDPLESDPLPLLIKNRSSGNRRLIFPGEPRSAATRVRAGTNDSFHRVGGVLFRRIGDRFHRFDGSWNAEPLSPPIPDPFIIGTTSNHMLVGVVRSSPQRIFRLDAVDGIVEVTSKLPQEDVRLIQVGEGFAAINPSASLSEGRFLLDHLIALSTDGLTWKSPPPLPAEQGYLIRFRERWLAFVLGGPSGSTQAVRIHRLNEGSGAWEVVMEADAAFNGPVANENFLIFRSENSIYRTADADHWEDSATHSPYASIAVPVRNTTVLGWFRASTFFRYSVDGFHWFDTFNNDPPPSIVVGDWAVRTGSAYPFRVARLSGSSSLRTLPTTVNQATDSSPMYLQAYPGPDWGVERFELFREGVLVATQPAHQPAFEVAEDRTGMVAYAIHAVLPDGERVVTEPMRLPWTRARAGEVHSLPDWAAFAASGQTHVVRSEKAFYAFDRGGPSPLLRSEDGLHWDTLSTLPHQSGLPYQMTWERPDGSTVFFFQRFTAPDQPLGYTLSDEGFSTFPKPPHNWNRYAAPFFFDGELHALTSNGRHYRYTPADTWEEIGRIPAVAALEYVQPISVSQGKNLYEIWTSERVYRWPDLNFRLLTRDFQNFFPLPILSGYSYEGLLPGTDDLLYLSVDKRHLLFLDKHGEIQPGGIRFPLALEKLTLLEGGFLVAETSNRSHAFLTGRTGQLWPLPVGIVAEPTYTRDATRLAVFDKNGSYYFIDLQDFHPQVSTLPEVIYGPLNRLRARVRLHHQGGLSTGAEVAITIRAWLRAEDGSLAHTYLGEREVDVSHLRPGAQRTGELTWNIPFAVGAGDFRLILQANGDNAIPSIKTGVRTTESATFYHHPDPELIIRETPFGHVEVEQPGSRFPQGSLLNIRARPDAGFAFIGWEGLSGDHPADLTLRLDASQALRARFLPSALAEAFPDLHPLPDGPWVADETGLLFSAMTADWAYHHILGWFTLAESSQNGAWLWFAAHGWRFRMRAAELYFDPVETSWQTLFPNP